MTITIMLAAHVDLKLAMLSGGLLVAGRRVAEIVAAPVSGIVADRFGVRGPLVGAALVLVVGLALIGVGWLIAGSLAVIVGRGALGTLIPAAVALFATGRVLQPLARNQTWRDIGAAAGPLMTGFMLDLTTPESLHLVLAVIFLASLLWLIASPDWRKSKGVRE